MTAITAPAAPARWLAWGRRNKLSAAVVISMIELLVVFAWALIPAFGAGALDQDILLGATPPGTPGHLLGTDALGRDIWLLTVAGAQTAIVGPMAIALASILLGLLLGLSAAYLGGWIDWVVSRFVDITLSLPSLLLAIVAAGVIGGGYWVSVAVMIVLFAPFDIRLIRSAALARVHEPYLEAAKLLGLGRFRVMFGHLMPVIRGLVGANLFLDMAVGLVALSSLSFLGLGVSPQQADWGRQLNDARALLFINPAAAIAPGVAIVLTAIAFNLVGDWLSERSGVAEG
ncbi:MAG TPA: ABC transporter permease [Propionicimonas sp.]|nr:ABC transporter permease [Propionicimonas sp.]